VSGRQAVPLADASALSPFARRTTIVRVSAAVVLAALGVAAIFMLRHPRVESVGFLPSESNGIVVLDLSASISTDTYSRIGATLGDLVATRGRYGLVVFSDTAYEALPPGTPADAFRPLIRYFTLPEQKAPGVAPTFPVNPWTESFSGGTRISAGLELARSIMIENRLPRRAVLLISDLDDAPSDLVRLAAIADAYRRERIPLSIVSLNAATEDERLFARLVHQSGSITQARLPSEQPRGSARTAFPGWFLAVALALAAVLAVNELAGARLTWGTRPRTGEAG
jgi:hypothetical protein